MALTRKKPPSSKRLSIRLRRSAVGLCGLEVGRTLFAGAPVGLDLVRDLLAFTQATDLGPLDGADVHLGLG